MAAPRDRSGETVDVGATSLRLGRLIKSGGAGSVYLLPQQPDSVAKVYHSRADRLRYQPKIEAMLALTPELPVREEHGHRYVQIAWPSAQVTDKDGQFLGFAMPLLDIAATSELEPVLQEKQARAAGLPTGLGAKLTLAANLAGIVAALHRQRHYVIDLKPVNLRFYRQSLYLAMLDCDGFSIAGHGRRFDADQFTPDYLAPEFQAGAIPRDGELAQDLFALAVVIFRLLNFGIHPFTGKPSSARTPTDIPGRIREHCYAYGLQTNPAMAPSPVSGHAQMPGELRRMFDQAFATRNRPGAADWADMLAGYARRDGALVVACARNPHHQHFANMDCAACAREAMLDHARQHAPARVTRRARGGGTNAPGTTARRGVPQPRSSGGVGGCLVILVLVGLFGWAMFSGSCSRKSTRAVVDVTAPARDPRPSVTPAPTVTITPVVRPPDPVVIQDTITSLLDVLGRGDIDAYRQQMAALQAAAARRPRAQPASLQLYYRALSDAGTTDRDASYRQIVKDDPYAAFAAIELGTRLLRDEQTTQAQAMFMQAAWVNPANPKAWYGLALAETDVDATRAAAADALAQLLSSDAREAQAVRDAFAMGVRSQPDANDLAIRARARELVQAARQADATTTTR